MVVSRRLFWQLTAKAVLGVLMCKSRIACNVWLAGRCIWIIWRLPAVVCQKKRVEAVERLPETV